MRRRGAVLLLACALAEAGCLMWHDYGCMEETGEGETVPPCPEAGIYYDASLDIFDTGAKNADGSMKGD